MVFVVYLPVSVLAQCLLVDLQVVHHILFDSGERLFYHLGGAFEFGEVDGLLEGRLVHIIIYFIKSVHQASWLALRSSSELRYSSKLGNF